MPSKRKLEIEHGYIQEISKFLFSFHYTIRSFHVQITKYKHTHKNDNDGDITDSPSYLVLPNSQTFPAAPLLFSLFCFSMALSVSLEGKGGEDFGKRKEISGRNRRY